MTARSLTIVLVGALAASALGFGAKGHAVVGFIADARLEPATKDALKEVLGRGRLAWISTWADAIRDEQPETAPWHYVNIPKDAAGYDAARDCGAEGCVVERIQHFLGVLKDRERDRLERLRALKWVVHLVGDLHQPLHCALAEDRGGNEIKVTFEGRPVNLHEFWDTTIIERQHLDDRAYADQLQDGISAEDAAEWSRGDPASWATESFLLGQRVAYRDEHGRWLRSGDTLSRAYFVNRTVVVDEQLKKAGVRLAALLNAAFAPEPPAAGANDGEGGR